MREMTMLCVPSVPHNQEMRPAARSRACRPSNLLWDEIGTLRQIVFKRIIFTWTVATGNWLPPGCVSSVQLLSRVRHFGTPWTAAHQASLSITNSWSLLKLMSIELVMPSNHLIPCWPLLLLPSIFPSIGSFLSQCFISGGQSVGASASVLPMNIQDWFPLGWTRCPSQCKWKSSKQACSQWSWAVRHTRI